MRRHHIITALILVLGVLLASSCENMTEDIELTLYKRVTGVVLDQSSITLKEGSSQTLTATVSPSDATNQDVFWQSSNGQVASVDNNGMVKGLKAGSATITVTTKNEGYSATCEVTVKDAAVDPSKATDLSSSGTANCYIVSAAGDYKFKPVQGNTSTSVGNVSSAEVLWETFGTATAPNVGDLVNTVSYSKGYITFRTTGKEGNALIAAKDAKGNILWSWHIWCTDKPKDQVYKNGAGTMMDRNLGATSATPGDVCALGLLYQWGRKDPFLGSSSISSAVMAQSTITWPSPMESNSSNGTIAYATSHPTTFIKENESNYDWYYTGSDSTDDTRWTSNKSSYDPCPSGYRVPDEGSNGVWSKALGPSSSFSGGPWSSSNKGMDFKTYFTSSTQCWYPASGYLSSSVGSLTLLGNAGSYWSCAPYGSSACNLFFSYDGFVYSSFFSYRALGLSVRCIKEGSMSSDINVSSVSLNKTSLTLTEGDTETLTATISPSNATNKNVSWKSSNTSVATVSSSGKVTAVKAGTTTITVTTEDGGKTATCSVTVETATVDPSKATDLSSLGTANSYIVSAAGDYKFKTVKGNTTTSVGSVSSASVVWETFGTATAPNVGDLVNTVSYSNGYICFRATGKEGNALIAAKDAGGNILWSWHIWCTDKPADQVYKNGAGTMMDRNLGAISATSGDAGALGLLYQWGRKDPFLGSSSISSSTKAKSTITWPSPVESNSSNGTIAYATSHPTTFITRNENNYDWYYTGSDSTDDTRWNSSKGTYDPCPPGYRVPDGGSSGIWSKALGSSSDLSNGPWNSTNKGMDFKTYFTSSTQCWYPASGCLHSYNGSLDDVGGGGDYWSCTPNSRSAYGLYFYNDGSVYPSGSSYRATGQSVRCIKEGSMPSDVNVSSVSLNKTSLTLTEGDTETLTATISPSNATNKNVSWKSSNTSVATVSSSGKVTAVKAGTATITVTTEDGNKTATCSVTVKAATVDPSKATDLSSSGTANCYIVSASGDYKFKTVKGNTSTSVGSVSSASVVWETYGTSTAPNVGDLVNTVSYSNGYICFRATGKEGNALIAAKDASGNILWSWHIWCTDKPSDQVYKNGAGTLMDRNLGATSATPGDVGALGLLYQWGRKDPFLGSSSISSDVKAKSTITWPSPVASNSSNGTIAYATSHPTAFIIYNENNYDWYYSGSSSTDDTRWSSDKGTYDPCPPGYRVPDGVWSKALGSSSSFSNGPWNSSNKGMDFKSYFTSSAQCWYPASGYLNNGDGSLNNVADYGYYWSCTPEFNAAICLYFYNGGGVYPSSSDIRASGLSVRCIKEGSMSSDINVSSVSLNKSSLTLTEGDTETLTATVSPSNATNKNVSWKSSNTSVATVSSSGKVTAVKAGSASITVTTEDGGKTATCSVTVKAKEINATDLSASGTANCYIVSASGDYKFKTVKGNTTTSVGSVSSASVVWETFGTATAPNVGDLVNTVSYSNGYITFKATGKEGNALIAAKDAGGNILWSWHIWCTDKPSDQVYKNNAGTMMDRNLGATSATPGDVGALGLLYQWGRKDPFLGSSSISSDVKAKSTITWPSPVASNSSNGTIAYSTAHPTIFISRNENNRDWYYPGSSSTDNTRWSSSKGTYDPCPPGYRVPDGGSNGVWSKTLGSSSSFNDGPWNSTNKGMDFKSYFTSSTQCWYPASGYLDGAGSLGSVGNDGGCWSCVSIGNDAYRLSFKSNGGVGPSSRSESRAYGRSVRCTRE